MLWESLLAQAARCAGRESAGLAEAADGAAAGCVVRCCVGTWLPCWLAAAAASGPGADAAMLVAGTAAALCLAGSAWTGRASTPPPTLPPLLPPLPPLPPPPLSAVPPCDLGADAAGCRLAALSAAFAAAAVNCVAAEDMSVRGLPGSSAFQALRLVAVRCSPPADCQPGGCCAIRLASLQKIQVKLQDACECLHSRGCESQAAVPSELSIKYLKALSRVCSYSLFGLLRRMRC